MFEKIIGWRARAAGAAYLIILLTATLRDISDIRRISLVSKGGMAHAPDEYEALGIRAFVASAPIRSAAAP